MASADRSGTVKIADKNTAGRKAKPSQSMECLLIPLHNDYEPWESGEIDSRTPLTVNEKEGENMSEYDLAMMEEKILWEESNDLFELWIKADKEGLDAMKKWQEISRSTDDPFSNEYQDALIEWKALYRCADLLHDMMEEADKKHDIATARAEALA